MRAQGVIEFLIVPEKKLEAPLPKNHKVVTLSKSAMIAGTHKIIC
jgi:hypothetical protein